MFFRNSTELWALPKCFGNLRIAVTLWTLSECYGNLRIAVTLWTLSECYGNPRIAVTFRETQGSLACAYAPVIILERCNSCHGSDGARDGCCLRA